MSDYRRRFQVMPLGAFVQADVNPALVHANVVPPVLAGPVTVALPVQRGPVPLSVGAEMVNVPEKAVLVTTPVMVPFQSKSVDAHVPVTLESV
jgi:hypothetical protein